MLVKRIAAYTHLPSTVYELQRYWSEIATFSYPLAFNAPVGIGILGESFGPQKTRIMATSLPGSEDSLTIG